MNPADYNYEEAGFDAFLSRSIDNLSQGNLDAAGPLTTQQRYDSTQLSGRVSDAIITEDVVINKDGVSVKDGKLTVYDEQGVLTISNGHTVIRPVRGTYNLTAADFSNLYAEFSFPHNLQTVPIVTGWYWSESEGRHFPLPYFYRADQSYFGDVFASAAVTIEEVDESRIYCRFNIYDALGLSRFLDRTQLNFVFDVQYQE